MGNDRETTQVIMSIQKAAMFMDPFFKLTMMGTAFLITYLARMAKEGKISRGEFNSVQDFIKATEGKYTITNVPFDKDYSPWEVKETIVEGKNRYIVRNSSTGEVLRGKNGEKLIWRNVKKAEKEMISRNQKENLALDELKEMGIRHVILPDLNQNDGMVQIAIFNEDKEKFVGWQERYLLSRMQGGEHHLRDLQNLTNGNTSLLSMPVEGDKMERMVNDFRELKINYAVLPDLNVGDGETQIVVANSDVPNVEFWMQMYNQDLLERGEEPKEMKSVTMDGYRRTGMMTEEQYADTASEELKKANEKYEGREAGDAEKAVREQEKGVRNINSEAYDEYTKNPEYVEISIDKETLVDHSRYASSPELSGKGLFACRIPGTYGENEQTLVVPEDRVFYYNGGQQYRVFLKQNEKPLVIGPSGEKIAEEKRASGEKLRNTYFDTVEKKSAERIKKDPVKNLNNFDRRVYDFEALERAILHK